MSIKDRISDTVDGITDERAEGTIPRQQPDGDPPVPPVEIPAPAGLTAEPADGVVTTDDLRELLHAPADAALVVEDGQARVVPDATAAEGTPVLRQADLATMLHGTGADSSDATLQSVATGLDEAVREQGV